MRTRVHTGRLPEPGRKIAGGSLGPDHRSRRAPWNLRRAGFDGERMHVDVAVGALLGAPPAADAPVFDDDLQRVLPPDRAYGADDHASGLAPGAEGRGPEILVVAQAVPDQPGDAVVSVGTRAHAGVAPRASLEIDQQEILGLHQALAQEFVERYALEPRRLSPIL